MGLLRSNSITVLFACLAICFCNVHARAAQTGTVQSHQKISDTEGGFTGILDDVNYFGWSVAHLYSHRQACPEYRFGGFWRGVALLHLHFSTVEQ